MNCSGTEDQHDVPMDTVQECEHHLHPSASDEASTDELTEKHCTKGSSGTAPDCFNSFHFWRVPPLTVDQSSVFASSGKADVTSYVNKLSLDENKSAESIIQATTADALGLYAANENVAAALRL